MPRGRLLFWKIIDFQLLDTTATQADPDGAGALTSGYDDVYREPVVRTVSGERTDATQYQSIVQLRAQIEDKSWDMLTMGLNGNLPDTKTRLILHWRELEKKNLYDVADGKPKIRVNDKVVAIRDRRGNLLVELDPPLYVTEVKTHYGFGDTRNLLHVMLEDREKGSVR